MKDRTIREPANKDWQDATRIITMIAKGGNPFAIHPPKSPQKRVTAETVKAICIVLAKLITARTAKPQSSLRSSVVPAGLQIPETLDLEALLASIQSRELVQSLGRSNGNHAAAARDLGISYRVLRYRLKRSSEKKFSHPPFDINHLPRRDGNSLDDYLTQIETAVLNMTIQRTKNNLSEASRRLGITFRSLRCRIKRLDLDV